MERPRRPPPRNPVVSAFLMMFEDEGLVRVAYGEFLRFGLAIEMQRDRLARWRDDLRNQREKSQDKRLEAIFSLPPGTDVREHLRQIQVEHEHPSLMHVKNEAHFLIVAIRNTDRMTNVLRSTLQHEEETVRCLQAAITAFEAAAPEIAHLRNLNEHMDELLQGKGDAFAKLPDPDLGNALAVLENDVIYLIGGKVWSTSNLADAAARLVSEVRSCLSARYLREEGRKNT